MRRSGFPWADTEPGADLTSVRDSSGWPRRSCGYLSSLSPMHGYRVASTRPARIVSRGKTDLSHASTVSNKAAAWMRFRQPRQCDIVVVILACGLAAGATAQGLKRTAIGRAGRAEGGTVQGAQHDAHDERGGGQLA